MDLKIKFGKGKEGLQLMPQNQITDLEQLKVIQVSVKTVNYLTTCANIQLNN
ncbi:MAG: hypothetical protein WBA41_14070 [Rivularia sp. (in: cyanobacteria)]